jgi:hypothetical protein
VSTLIVHSRLTHGLSGVEDHLALSLTPRTEQPQSENGIAWSEIMDMTVFKVCMRTLHGAAAGEYRADYEIVLLCLSPQVSCSTFLG